MSMSPCYSSRFSPFMRSLKADRVDEDGIKKQYLYLGAVFAAGAALTKQNGLLIFGFYPLLAFLLVTDKMRHENTKDRLRILFQTHPPGFGGTFTLVHLQ